jgi:hypothetical protein
VARKMPSECGLLLKTLPAKTACPHHIIKVLYTNKNYN